MHQTWEARRGLGPDQTEGRLGQLPGRGTPSFSGPPQELQIARGTPTNQAEAPAKFFIFPRRPLQPLLLKWVPAPPSPSAKLLRLSSWPSIQWMLPPPPTKAEHPPTHLPISRPPSLRSLGTKALPPSQDRPAHLPKDSLLRLPLHWTVLPALKHLLVYPGF